MQINSPAAEVFLTVAVCTRNRCQALAKALEGLRSEVIPEVEILVVDNGSTDGTAAFLKKLSADWPVLRFYCEPAPGIPRARNAAVANARGEIILFFDDDELPVPGWLKAHFNFWKTAKGNVACAAGPAYPEFDAPVPRWFDKTSVTLDIGGDKRALSNTFGIGCGNSSYRRAAILAVGGFDGAMARHEETELNTRLKDKGYEFWWLPDAQILHCISVERISFARLTRAAYGEGFHAATLRYRIHSAQVSSAATYQQVLSAVAARAASVRRRQGKSDADIVSARITREYVQNDLGIDLRAIDNEIASTFIDWSIILLHAGATDRAVALIREARSCTQRTRISARGRSYVSLAEAGVAWRQKRRASSAKSLLNAICVRPNLIFQLHRRKVRRWFVDCRL